LYGNNANGRDDEVGFFDGGGLAYAVGGQSQLVLIGQNDASVLIVSSVGFFSNPVTGHSGACIMVCQLQGGINNLANPSTSITFTVINVASGALEMTATRTGYALIQ
jgi:hypothetical protein